MTQKSRFTPSVGLRLLVPEAGILLVEEVCGEANLLKDPGRCFIVCRWSGHVEPFKINAREWFKMTTRAQKSYW